MRKKGTLSRGYPQICKGLISLMLGCGKRVVQNGIMKIGYARVSTEEQNLDLQIEALQGAGCDAIFEDKGIAGTAIERPGLN